MAANSKIIDRKFLGIPWDTLKLKDPNLSDGDRQIIHDILKDTQDVLSN